MEFGYLALVDGVPAATADAVLHDGWLYVAAVATHPDYRRRGLAEAVMRRALEEAMRATGVTRTALDASAMGAPVYKAMGYEPTGEIWRAFSLPH